MKYYKLMYDFAMITSNEKSEQYENNIVKGEVIKEWNKDIEFNYDCEDGKIFTDYLASDNGWLIVSKKFRDAIAKIVSESIQYLDIKIVSSESKDEYSGYKVAKCDYCFRCFRFR